MKQPWEYHPINAHSVLADSSAGGAIVGFGVAVICLANDSVDERDGMAFGILLIAIGCIMLWTAAIWARRLDRER